jgi:hypothetical protein
MDAGAPGFIINPWGQSFMLTTELADMILKADGGVEYHVPKVKKPESSEK